MGRKKRVSDKSDDKRQSANGNWGPRLFLGAVVAVLAFFYWLLIYSGGVTVHHG
jgi:hypothetical protein